MQPYLDMVAKHPEITHVVLSLSMTDGFSVSFRKRARGGPLVAEGTHAESWVGDHGQCRREPQ